MLKNGRTCASLTILIAALQLVACSTPTLVQVARRRQASDSDYPGGRGVKDNVNVSYHITDRDVLNFSDEVKRKLANRSNINMGVRYGSAGAQTTLGALAGSAKTFGWALSTASALGAGATYIFGLGQIFDAKGRAQAYEQAFTEIQAAEANFYFRQVGMDFKKDEATGRSIVDFSGVKAAIPNAGNIPNSARLTPDGETLYYRVSKILKVLNDVLAGKIPDLQDLKETKGETGGSNSPSIPAAANKS